MPEDNRPPKPEAQTVVSPQPDTQPTRTVDVNAIYPQAGTTNSQPLPEQTPEQKPSKGRIFLIVLGVLQASGVALILLASLWATQQAKAGVSGMEFLMMALFFTVYPVLMIIAALNLASMPGYMRKHKPRGMGLAFSITSLAISLLIVASALVTLYNLIIAPKELPKYEYVDYGETQQSNTRPGVSKRKALDLMESCKADYFAGYTDISLVEDQNSKSWLNAAEKSRSGIEILENSPKTYVFVSKGMTAEMQEAAKRIRQSCYDTRKLYITVDDWIETEYPPGQWTRVKQ